MIESRWPKARWRDVFDAAKVAPNRRRLLVTEARAIAREERHMRFRSLTIAIAAVVLPALAAPFPAEAAVKIGALRCDVSGGLGLIITSSKEMRCFFSSAHGYREWYYGTIRKFGLDLGATSRGVLAWAVFAPTAGARRGALAGDYVGADASVAVGAGVGANALVGGFDRSFTLQPLSVEVQSGVALAAGVASLSLRTAP
jgi:hypothetical protein